MATWHIERTRELVKERFGIAQLDLTRPSLQSLVDRQDYARYHYEEINALFAAFRAKHLSNASSILALTDEGDREFQLFILKSGAHGVACLQCLHSMMDILAHVIYYSLGLNLNLAPLRERDIGISSVLPILKTSTAFRPIFDKVTTVVESESYQHVAAAANVSKHRSVVGPSISEDWRAAGAEAHSVKFKSFQYGGRTYPSLAVRAALEPVYDASAVLMVDVGNAINDALQVNAP